MSTPDEPVDFDTVRKNAKAQGIDLSQIAIVYSNLTEAEIDSMTRDRLISHDAGTGTVIAHFRTDGEAAFPEKATGTLYLGAD